MKNFRIAFLFFCSGISVASAQNATDIVRKADEKMQGENGYAEMVMKIVRPEWSREITMKSWSKDQDYSLILITGPARDKGTAFLKRKQEMWNWQPSIDRVIKLPPSMMMQSWMGSDFTNDDLVRQSSIVTDYTHKLLGDTLLAGRKCWKLELIPKEDAPVVWGRIEACIDQKDYLQLLIKYYDEDNYLVNTMVLSEIKEMGGRELPTHMEMIPAENPDQKTVIDYLARSFNTDQPEEFFSIQNLKKIR